MTRDPADWPGFVGAHIPYVYTCVVRSPGGQRLSREDAEDVCQAALERALKADPGQRTPAARRGLLWTCAHRAVQDYWRAKWYRFTARPKPEPVELPAELAGDDPFDVHIAMLDTVAGLEQLDGRQAVAIRLSADGYTQGEIGELYRVSGSRICQLAGDGRRRLSELVAA